MIARKLRNYEWRYENGVATLIDKKGGNSFKLPIFYVNSFIRAGITFINAHRKEQLLNRQARINSLKLSKANISKKSAEKSKKASEVILKQREQIKRKWEARLRVKGDKKVLALGEIKKGRGAFLVTFNIERELVKPDQQLVADIQPVQQKLT